MKWIKYKIKTLNDAADIVASVLFDNKICGVEIEDSLNPSDEELKAMYVDIPVVKENTGVAYVSFYVSISSDLCLEKSKNVVSEVADNSYTASNDNVFTSDEFDKILKDINTSLDEYKNFMDLGELSITTEELDDKIFLNKWKENFKSFDIDDISIIPSWEKDKTKKDRLNIYIEPGSAFGTGQHATTRLCVRNIKKLVDDHMIILKNSSMLDVGCGSGILAIVSKKLGINNVKAIDIDVTVKENLATNILLNFTDYEYSAYELPSLSEINDSKKYIDFDFGNLIDDVGFNLKIKQNSYDLLVANILAPVIISLVEKAKIAEFIKKDGYFLCSGIIADMKDKVLKSIENSGDFKVISVDTEGEWNAICCKKI